MTSKTSDQSNNFGRLKSEYKAAFDEWAAQVSALRMLSEAQSDSHAIDEVRAKADVAEAAYRETRDQLAGMVSCP